MPGAIARGCIDVIAGIAGLAGMVPALEPDAILQAADVPAEDDPRALEPLAAMCDSIKGDLALAPRGRLLMAARMVEIVRQRRILLDRDSAGELPAVPESSPPVVVTGFPRSGTTLSHRILSLAGDARFPQWCEVMQPSLDPALEIEKARRKRLNRTRYLVRFLQALAPDFQRIHELIADGPEECTQLHEVALDSESFGLLGPVNHYRDWLDERDEARRRERYEWQDRGMRAIHADRPEPERGERWVLKAPQHLCQLDDLLDRFPGALVVRMHRDPIACMASTASLVASASKIPTRGLPPGLGDDLLDIFIDWQGRGDDSMARHPDRVLEMHYDDLVADPIAFVERIHEAAGIPAEGEHLDRVREHLRRRPRHHFGRHRYSIEDYGLDEVEVREKLAGHVERVRSIPRITTPKSG